MPKIGTEVVISTAHFVQTSSGKCQNLHGHNWKVEIQITGIVRSDGMVVDFSEIKNGIMAYDHKMLVPTTSEIVKVELTSRNYYNIEVKEFKDPMNPQDNMTEEPKVIKKYKIPKDEVALVPISEVTAENLANFFRKEMLEMYQVDEIVVRVWESDKSWAESPSR